MQTTNFNLRGIDPHVMSILRKKAENQHISINVLILNCIEQSIGYSHKINRPQYDDLDYLAGTWKKNDLAEFNKNTQFFETIDKDLWS